jgi:hypothetical protein
MRQPRPGCKFENLLVGISLIGWPVGKSLALASAGEEKCCLCRCSCLSMKGIDRQTMSARAGDSLAPSSVAVEFVQFGCGSAVHKLCFFLWSFFFVAFFVFVSFFWLRRAFLPRV